MQITPRPGARRSGPHRDGPRRSARHPAAPHRAALALVPVALVAVLAGCSSTVSVGPGPDAADPVCAQVVNALPEEVGDLTARDTDAQATAAWADDRGTVVVRCGVEPLAPTTDPCTGVPTATGSVDWVQDSQDSTRFTTYGRVPAVEVVVPVEDEINPVLTAVSTAAEAIEQTSACLGRS